MKLAPTSSSGTSGRPTLSGLELRCPPLPQTLMEAMDLIERPEHLEVEPVTEMVQRDPIVVARLLHIVNSAYYGLRHEINSAERAVVMLGPVAVTGIVVGMNMMRLNTTLNSEAILCFNRLVRHSIATAFLTRHLLEGPPRAHLMPLRKATSRLGVSFTAGLLHDFGKIILVYNFPNEAVEFYQRRTLQLQISDHDSRQLEQLLFGYDHTEAGEFVARKLGFPDLLTDVVRFHHSPENLEGRNDMHRILRATYAANLASKAMGFAFTSPITWKEAVHDPIWESLIASDLNGHTSPSSLIEEVIGLKDHLGQYVTNMLGTYESRLTELQPLGVAHKHDLTD